MKTLSLLILLILTATVVLLAACGESAATPTLVPTAEPPTAVQKPATEEPTEAPTEDPQPEPTAEPADEVSETGPETAADNVAALQTNPWQWTGFTSPVEQLEVEMPETYTFSFNEDGTVEIKADCNNAGGTYTADESSLTIEIGLMTMAACPEESRSDQFVSLLGGAAIYFFEDGDLFIDLMADGGTMTFAPASGAEVVAEDSERAIKSTLPEDLTALLDAYLQSQVYTEGGDPALAAPGLVVYVETPDAVYLNAVGVANLKDGTPINGEDVLEIGSNTKSMTIVLLMQLVEEGLLSLDDPLSQYLPEQAAILPNGDEITLRQMAQHTAGLWDYGDEIIGDGVADPAELVADYTPDELIQYAVNNGEPYFTPGEEGKWYYSNTGYILLGMIIELVSGETYGELLQTRIFDPLELESAALLEGVPQEGDLDTNGYYWTKTGDSLDVTNWNGSQGWAAGAVTMTAEDLATYGKALAAGELFQDPDTLQEMLTWEPGSLFGVGGPYGLGLIDMSGDGTVWGHEGATLGFQSLWYTEPDSGIIVVGLTNGGNYKAFAFLNVLNILEGKGAQPLSPVTILPVGSFAPTTWDWVQFINPLESSEIDEATGLRLVMAKDNTVTINSSDCGSAFGTYVTDSPGRIDFEIDPSTLVCDVDSSASQLVQLLNDAAIWSFNNGRLLIELPLDGGTMVFEWNQNPDADSAEEESESEDSTKWRWISFTDPASGETLIDDGGFYSFILAGDLAILNTGCRAVVVSYETDGSALTLTYDIPEISDESCEEGSYADQYYELLQGAALMFTEEGFLYIDLIADGGTLVFEPAP